MVPCMPYKGPICGGGPSCQPFRVVVAPAANLMMDFHAHLCTSEVIGILGGIWDPKSQVVRCDPCLAPSASLHVSFELKFSFAPAKSSASSAASGTPNPKSSGHYVSQEASMFLPVAHSALDTRMHALKAFCLTSVNARMLGTCPSDESFTACT